MNNVDRIPVWDIWIRLFHWSLAGGIAFLLFSGLTGMLFIEWHRPVGEAVMALILFRILWGMFGSENARLYRLFRNPVDGLKHLADLFRRKLHSERGHNAAGGLAVLAMLVIIGTQAVTGFFIADEEELIEGALYGSVSSSTSELLYSIHKFNAGLLQIIVGVHILAVLVYLLYARQNLIRPMITGRMRWRSQDAIPPLKLQHWSVGFFLSSICVIVVGLTTGWFS